MPNLPPRCVEVLKLMFAGCSNKEIGKRLGISELTVKNHIEKILRRLGAHNRQNACYRALQMGLIGVESVDVVLHQIQEPLTWLAYGPLQICPDTRRVRINGASFELDLISFSMLHGMLKGIPRTFTRQQLLDIGWGAEKMIEEKAVDMRIYHLRKALRPYGLEKLILSDPGVGFRINVELLQEPLAA